MQLGAQEDLIRKQGFKTHRLGLLSEHLLSPPVMVSRGYRGPILAGGSLLKELHPGSPEGSGQVVHDT